MSLILKKYKEDIDRPLSAILTLNTIAHTVGAIMVGVQASKLFGESGIDFGLFTLNGEGFVGVVMTLLILVLSEIIPKTLGANYWKGLTPFTLTAVRFLMTILAPLVWISQLITKNLKKDKETSVLSRADFSALAYSGGQSGALKEEESRTIRNLLRLDQITVKSIMTPRSVMNAGDTKDTLESLYDGNKPFRYSRIPIFDDKREHIIGILLKDTLLESLYQNKGQDLVSLHMRAPIFISESESLSQLQDVLMGNKNHMAIVVDDFGAILGLVTMEDLFETILGLEILDESDDVTDLQKHARDIWEKRSKKLRMN